MTTRICFVTKEVFAWGKYGGFGKYVRTVGAELIRRGFEVSAVIPRSADQRTREVVDGITVLGLPYPTSLVDSVASELLARACAPYFYRKCQADIYHSINPSFYTLLAMLGRPRAKHLIAFCDLRGIYDWRVITSIPSLATLPNRLRAFPVESPFMRRIVRQADVFYAMTKFLAEKAVEMYGLQNPPTIVRFPYEPPGRKMKKSDKPTVCFLGRLDLIKRPWIFFELARDFPGIEFCVIGRSTVPSQDLPMIKRYTDLKNLKFFGLRFGEEKSQLLEKSWILINTSIHEGLPTAFLEAWGHECSVLSGMNPDGLVERFGYWVRDGRYSEGLRYLLSDENWQEKGKAGRRYVEKYHNIQLNINQLIRIYRDLLTQA